MLHEFRAEAAITKRVLDCVPADKLTWKPHAKSMTLGQLAGHIAAIPGRISRLAQQDSFDVLKGSFVPPQPDSLEEILSTLEQGVRDAEQILQGMTDGACSRAVPSDERGPRTFQPATVRNCTDHHAESLVSPSRAVVGLSATAGGAIARDLRSQRGYGPVRLVLCAESAGKVKMCAVGEGAARIMLACGVGLESYSSCLNVGAAFSLLPPSPFFSQIPNLVYVAERARAGTARIPARSAGSGRSRGTGLALGGNCENRELRLELLRVALGALGFFFAVNQRLELMVAFLADVFVNGHFTLRRCSRSSIRINLWGLRKFHNRILRNLAMTGGGIPGG